MQTKFVEANGLRFEVLEEGTGDRLALCLHGFPEHAISWRHQIPVLAGMRYRVWAVNQRGYGRTTRPTQVADYALPHLVDDVTALINAASAKSVVLIGHDWGAMVAWCFAAEQLQRHIVHKMRQSIVSDLRGPGGAPVSALIDRPDAIAHSCRHRYLVPRGDGVLRKAVQAER
jgi:pimeloyl-ACP methyl ester carboxylesterase